MSQARCINLKSFLEAWLSQSTREIGGPQPIIRGGKKHRTLTQHRPGVESRSAPCSVCDLEWLHKLSGLLFHSGKNGGEIHTLLQGCCKNYK